MGVLDQGAHMLMDGRLYAQHKYAFPSPLLAVVELLLLCEDPRTVQETPKGHPGDTCRIPGGTHWGHLQDTWGDTRGTPAGYPGDTCRIPRGYPGDTCRIPGDTCRIPRGHLQDT